jgi:hypothetical protein
MSEVDDGAQSKPSAILTQLVANGAPFVADVIDKLD